MARFPLRLSSTSPKRQRQQQLMQIIENAAASRSSHGTPTRRRNSRSSPSTPTRTTRGSNNQQQQVADMAQRLDLELGNLQESLSQKQEQLQSIQGVNRRGNLNESLSQQRQQPQQQQGIDTWLSRPGTPSGKKSPEQEQQHMGDLAQSLGMTLGNLQNLLSQVQPQQQVEPKVDTNVRQRRDPPPANPNVDTNYVHPRRDPPGHGGRARITAPSSKAQQPHEMTVHQQLDPMQHVNDPPLRFVRPDLMMDDAPSFPVAPQQQQRDDQWISVKQAPASKQQETPLWEEEWTPRREESRTTATEWTPRRAETRTLPTQAPTARQPPETPSWESEWMTRRVENSTMPKATKDKTNISFDSHSTATTQNTSSVDCSEEVVRTPPDTNARVQQNYTPAEDGVTDLPKYSPPRYLAQSAFARVTTMDSTSTSGTSVCPAETAQVRNMRHARLRDQSPLSLHRPTSPLRRRDNVGHYQPVASPRGCRASRHRPASPLRRLDNVGQYQPVPSPRGRCALRKSRSSLQNMYSTSTTSRPAVLLPKRVEEIPYHPKRSSSPDSRGKPQANYVPPRTSNNRQEYSTLRSEVVRPERPEEPPFYPKFPRATRDEIQNKEQPEEPPFYAKVHNVTRHEIQNNFKADLVHPPPISSPEKTTINRASSPVVSTYSAEMAYNPVQQNLHDDEIETFVEIETIEDESLIHFQDKLVYGVEEKVEPKATYEDEESEGTADESEEAILLEDADETIEEAVPKSSSEATSAGTHASNDTFDRSVTDSFSGDWDPEKDISLFYEKYQKMGTFNVGAKVETEDKPLAPGFFEALGKAVDGIQNLVCSDATKSCRCEPPIELCPLPSRKATPGKELRT